MSANFVQITNDYLILLNSLALSVERGEPVSDLPQVIANSYAKKMYDAGAQDLDVYYHLGAQIKTILEKTPESKNLYRSVLQTAYAHILICQKRGY